MPTEIPYLPSELNLSGETDDEDSPKYNAHGAAVRRELERNRLAEEARLRREEERYAGKSKKKRNTKRTTKKKPKRTLKRKPKHTLKRKPKRKNNKK